MGTTITKRKQLDISVWGILLIITGALLLGLFVLLPFKLHSYSSINPVIVTHTSSAHGCVSTRVTTVKECLEWSAPHSAQLIGVLGIGVFVLLGALTMWYVWSHSSFRELKTFTIAHLIIAVLAVTSFSGTYVLVRNNSLDNELSATASAEAQLRYELGLRAFVQCNQLPNSAEAESVACAEAAQMLTPIKALQYVFPGKNLLGYGMMPIYVVLIDALYLVVPLLNWYRIALDPKRINGQKREELFQ